MIAIIMFLGACSNEALFNQNDKELSPEINPNTGRTLSLTATMPGDNPTTRVALTQEDDLAITLTWEEGDELQLVFVQGEIKIKKTVTVDNISDGGVKAQFDIELPTEITGNFDLYGVYGGDQPSLILDVDLPKVASRAVGSEDNPTDVILPKNSGMVTSLKDLETKENVMLYFENKGIEITDSEVLVEFKHLGSIFSITLKNTGVPKIENIAEVRLVGIDNVGNTNWAYNSEVGGQIYDLVSGKFQNIETAGNYISFKADESTLEGGESITFWGWYPPLPGVVWPKLKLELRNASGAVLKTSANSKLARTEAPVAGKYYYLNAIWDSFYLKFANVTGGKDILYEENLEDVANRNNYDKTYWDAWKNESHKPIGVVNVVTEGNVSIWQPYARWHETDGGVIEAGVWNRHLSAQRGTAWFILPSVNLNSYKDPVLSFDFAIGPTNKVDPEQFDVFVSTDFDGTNISSATWNKHTAELADFNGKKLIDGQIPERRHVIPLRKYTHTLFLDLSAYNGQEKVYVGFRNTSLGEGVSGADQSFYGIVAPIKIDATKM